MEKAIIKAAAQLYSARDFTQTPDDVAETFRRIHEDGFCSAQISGFGAAIPPEHVRDLIRQYKIDVCVTHSSFDRMRSDLDGLIAEHKMWDCPRMGIGSMPQSACTDRASLDEFIATCNRIAARLAAEGMVLTYHNHHFEFMRFGEDRIIDLLLDGFSENVQFVMDSHWIQVGGASPEDYFRAASGRMDVCHFKDMVIERDPAGGYIQRFAEVGYGNLNFRRLMKVCADIGVRYIAIEQDDCYGANPFDCMKRSRDWLVANQDGMYNIL